MNYNVNSFCLPLLKVLSGDCVVVRGQPKGGPPPEQQIALSNIVAPKVGRRANPNIEGSLETRDEVCGYKMFLI